MTRRAALTLLAASAASPAARRPLRAYVGTYSGPGNGKGIHLFEMDPATGRLTETAVAASAANPAWLELNRAGSVLYSADETEGGSVTAWAVDAATGRLRPLNTVSSGGAGPAHLSLHPSGRWIFTANYFAGSVAVLPVQPDGSLGPPAAVERHTGPVGPAKAAGAPPGSFAISGHDRPHAHMAASDPTGRFLLAADLGLDQIRVWRFDDAIGRLLPGQPPFVSLPPGDGPRHFVFHSNGKWLYSLQEEGSTLVLFDWDPSAGRLTPRQTVSSLPQGFAGTNFTSEVRLSPDGRFLYAANRLHDSIAWFSIASDGRLQWAGEAWTRGDYPRSFSIHPSGEFLYCANQRSDAVACFRINRRTGEPAFTGAYTPVGSPAIIVFA